MSNNTISFRRSHVLGELYNRCEPIESIPVYSDDTNGEQLGYADESLGYYADAICFHLADDVCKKLAGGRYVYSFNYDFSDPRDKSTRRRIKLSSICLIHRKPVEPAVTRGRKASPESTPVAIS